MNLTSNEFICAKGAGRQFPKWVNCGISAAADRREAEFGHYLALAILHSLP
jgi:hypothetical protein